MILIHQAVKAVHGHLASGDVDELDGLVTRSLMEVPVLWIRKKVGMVNKRSTFFSPYFFVEISLRIEQIGKSWWIANVTMLLCRFFVVIMIQNDYEKPSS